MRPLLVATAIIVTACSSDGTPPNAGPPSAALTKDAMSGPTLLARAILPANAYQPGPISGF